MKRNQKLYSILFSLCLLAFTAYALLDTFVITRVYTTVEDANTGTYTDSNIVSAE